MIEITEAEARAWLDGYKKAWEAGDGELAEALFSEDVVYRERRYTTPLKGRESLRAYWRSRVEEFQRDIRFDCDLWAVRANQAFVGWTASFTWTPINGAMELDGVMRLRFAERRDGMLVCESFEEWFDLREI